MKKKILAVCSQNQWRSPTAEKIYQGDQRVEVRSAGTSPSAIHSISQKDIVWADEILVMEPKHREMIQRKFPDAELPPISVLHIPDNYRYMDEELIEILKDAIEPHIV